MPVIVTRIGRNRQLAGSAATPWSPVAEGEALQLTDSRKGLAEDWSVPISLIENFARNEVHEHQAGR